MNIYQQAINAIEDGCEPDRETVLKALRAASDVEEGFALHRKTTFQRVPIAKVREWNRRNLDGETFLQIAASENLRRNQVIGHVHRLRKKLDRHKQS